MPPKRSQARKRATRTADEGPAAQRSRRQSTRNTTLASQSTASVRAEAEASAVLSSCPAMLISVFQLFLKQCIEPHLHFYVNRGDVCLLMNIIINILFALWQTRLEIKT